MGKKTVKNSTRDTGILSVVFKTAYLVSPPDHFIFFSSFSPPYLCKEIPTNDSYKVVVPHLSVYFFLLFYTLSLRFQFVEHKQKKTTTRKKKKKKNPKKKKKKKKKK